MAAKKLQDLVASTSPNDADIMIIEDTAATKKITFLNLFNKIKNKLGLSTIATSGKLADATGDTNNRTIKDTERTKWDEYETSIKELNRNLKLLWTGNVNQGYIHCDMSQYKYLIINMGSSCSMVAVTGTSMTASAPNVLYTGTKYISGFSNVVFDFYPDHLYILDRFDTDTSGTEYREGRCVTGIIGVF